MSLYMTESQFGVTPQGEDLKLFTLGNGNMEVKVTNLGGVIVSVLVPDKTGKIQNVVLGYDNWEGYVKNPNYFGAVVGRFANRIAGGRFNLDGKEYQLDCNSGRNHLHGGVNGFHLKVWDHKKEDQEAVRFSYLSKDGEENYPGNLEVTLTYALTPADEFKITYQAHTDQPTILNLTNHSYFNLAGLDGGPTQILDHELWLNSDTFTHFDTDLIPTGELASVDGTPLDFREAALIGSRIDSTDNLIKLAGGYDHNYVLNSAGDLAQLAARAEHSGSGRILEMYTTEPGVQFFSGNNVNRTGFCLETQHFPDSPNHPHFPPVILRPGQSFQSTTIYKFLTQD